MTFAVTGLKARVPEIVLHDTEQEAREQAEKWLRSGYNDVAVWSQVAVPRLETTVNWGGPSDH